MKKFNFSLLAGLLLLISASVCAENTPEKVQETFKKMYPKVTTVEWMHKSDYHIAGFVSDSHEKNAWFGNNAQWIMTETNVKSLEDVPAQGTIGSEFSDLLHRRAEHLFETHETVGAGMPVISMISAGIHVIGK